MKSTISSIVSTQSLNIGPILVGLIGIVAVTPGTSVGCTGLFTSPVSTGLLGFLGVLGSGLVGLLVVLPPGTTSVWVLSSLLPPVLPGFLGTTVSFIIVPLSGSL